MPDIATLSINLVTLGQIPDLRSAVETCARMGIRAVGPLCQQVEAAGPREAGRLLRGSGMRVTSFGPAGFFTAEEAQDRRRRRDDNRRALEAAEAIGAECLVILGGGLPPRSRDITGARHMVEDGLAELLDDAVSAGVPLAIEPQHPMHAADRGCITTLAQALDICDTLGDKGIGVAVDLYNLWWDPELERQLERAGSRILLLQIADWLRETGTVRDDRGMPGEGVIEIPRLRRLVLDQGYGGLDELEVPSRTWWARDAMAVLRMCIERHESAC